MVVAIGDDDAGENQDSRLVDLAQLVIFAARRSFGFLSGSCHRIRVGLAETLSEPTE